MGTNTGISWTQATWNPLVGCTKVSRGCKHCYAKTLHDRRHRAYLAGKDVPGQYAIPFETIQLMPERLTQPLHWRAPRYVFVNSVSDLFHEDVPEEFIYQVFNIMRRCPQHTFQILTKRPERMRDIVSHMAWGPNQHGQFDSGTAFRGASGTQPLPNVWLGTSVENQATADVRIPYLLATPTALRFLSCEPILGPIDLSSIAWPVAKEISLTGVLRDESEIDDWRYWLRRDDGIKWVICGGESGPGYRPMHLDWARSLRDQCAHADVPFHFKQVGGITPKAGGKLLDGVEWCAIPEMAS